MKHKSSCFWNGRRVLVLLVAVLLVLPMAAATKKKSTKHAPLTHNYKEAPLSAVFADITKKCDYELVYDPADVDLDKRITMRFKDASAKSVLKKVLDRDLEYKVKKSKIFISRKPVPPTEYKVSATIPTQVDEDSTKIVSIYTDTLYSISCRTVTKEVKNTTPVKPSDKGHYVQAMVGLGYSSLAYSLKEDATRVGRNQGDLGGLLQVQYAYYFHENWGVSAGVGFSAYGSHAVLNHSKTWLDQADSDGERYNHIATTHNWREQQMMHMVDFPIAIQCAYSITEKLKLYASTGIRLGVPVLSRYQLRSGEVEHSGYYPISGAHISQMPDRDFYTEQIGSVQANGTGYDRSAHALDTKKLGVGVMADLGVMIPLTNQLDMMVGAYFQMNCNNMRSGVQEMGWQHSEATAPIYRHDFMPAYAGVVASEYVDAVRPYQLGVKVGVSWHAKPRQKPQTQYERIQYCDTTITLVARHDTLVKPVQPAAKEIQRLMRKSVIWFDVNSTEPKLEPADILDKIAEVMKANPEQKIIVSGHASSEGNARKNRVLSEMRAKVVADMLMEKGVAKDQITVEAHSSDVRYQTEDGTAHTISLDRRTEIIPVTE